jgi:EAL domain-containing protein (putative c-di-GMP-specific phosphodiesterase class I)/uncharacterized coiled-coil DUF342 family protein
MESGIGVNSPEFLQKKIDRLKTALEEANVLMDRQVTERDEARAQLEGLKHENRELKRELEELRAQLAAAPGEGEVSGGLDPELEQSLRDRIARLESEREALQAGSPDGDQELRNRIDSLQGELDAARRERETARGDLETTRGELETTRGELETTRGELDGSRGELESARGEVERSRGELDAIRRDRDSARGQADSARADAEAARRESQTQLAAAEAARKESQTQLAAAVRRPVADADELPAAGPFVSQEVIRDALDNDNFVLFCQPVFSLQAERITQYELLLRLRDADGRMVRPFGFLEPADRFGLMGEIDRWVVTHALDLLERDGTGELRLEVNVAGQSLADYELTSLIEQHIAMTDLDPGRLIIEVSENIAAANLDDCKRLAKQLRGLGCGFALDDFGSTFASFRHLRDLPINYLKIDGDLVVTVTESRTATLTIKSLVELAKGLGAETIAEYVSDDQTLEFLREQGVGYAQGYRIDRPRPVEDVLNMQGTHEHQPAPPPKRVERPALESGGEENTGDAADVTPSETT